MTRVAPSTAVKSAERSLRPQANRVLAAVGEDDLRALEPSGQVIHVSRGTLLYATGDEMRYAYFPLRGLLSLMALSAEGGSLQLAFVDNRGFAGVPILLQGPGVVTPHHVVAQFPCDLYRVRANTLASEAQRRPHLRRTTLEWAQHHVEHLGQAAVCYRFHTVHQRLSRMLLACSASLCSDRIEITQELLAQMLGAPRSAVSKAAVQLQDHGWIRQRHGRVWILNRAGLVSATCECQELDTRSGP